MQVGRLSTMAGAAQRATPYRYRGADTSVQGSAAGRRLQLVRPPPIPACRGSAAGDGHRSVRWASGWGRPLSSPQRRSVTISSW